MKTNLLGLCVLLNSMIATEVNWDRFYSRLQSIINSRVEHNVKNVYITGSLATGKASEKYSDVDIVIGFDADSYKSKSLEPRVRDIIENKFQSELLDLIDIELSGIHVVSTDSADRAPHSAIQLQNQGNRMAEKYNKRKSKTQIYDMESDKIIKSVY